MNEPIANTSTTMLSPIMMSFVAGMSTGLGGCVIFFVTSVSGKTMSFTLSLAAGVMTSVSILELLKPILDGSIPPLLWAMAGAGFYMTLRYVVPEAPRVSVQKSTTYDKRERSEENNSVREMELLRARNWRLGILMMLTLTAHNLPEGKVKKKIIVMFFFVQALLLLCF
jgi:zinc transporter, ZIP family